MRLFADHRLACAAVLGAVATIGSVFALARPQYHPARGLTIRLPDKAPAADATGAAGWAWRDGTPGWPPGFTIKGYNVSGLQPIEVQAAQLAAARAVLDASALRVVDSIRPDADGALAILAAPTLYQTPVKTCLAALLQGDAAVRWECPSDLSHRHVLVAARRLASGSIDVVGVARGDVVAVVLRAPTLPEQTLYTRGKTWGQFDAAVALPHGRAELRVFTRRGLAETVSLVLAPGAQRVFR